MNLLIDGDALPNLLKPTLLSQIQRLDIPTIIVSNKKITIGNHHTIEYIIVEISADEADHKIVELSQSNDLVITADIPLADRVVSKGAYALNHRGEIYDKENIKHHLMVRNLMSELRDAGEITKGPVAFNKKDVHKFASELNKFLQKVFKK